MDELGSRARPCVVRLFQGRRRCGGGRLLLHIPHRRTRLVVPKCCLQQYAFLPYFGILSQKMAVKQHLVVVAELLEEWGLDGLGGRSVQVARVAHRDQHLLGCLGPRRGLLHLAYPSTSAPPPPPALPLPPSPPQKPGSRDANPSRAI